MSTRYNFRLLPGRRLKLTQKMFWTKTLDIAQEEPQNVLLNPVLVPQQPLVQPAQLQQPEQIDQPVQLQQPEQLDQPVQLQQPAQLVRLILSKSYN